MDKITQILESFTLDEIRILKQRLKPIKTAQKRKISRIGEKDICNYCKKEFIITVSCQKSCNENCKKEYRKQYYRKWEKEHRPFRTYRMSQNRNAVNIPGNKKISIEKAHQLETKYSKQKQYYSDKIINYTQSPTGKAYIGFAKLPLMPNDNGIGFKGVKLQSENRMLLQCSACGQWRKQLNNSHLTKCSGLTMGKYKEKFGFCKKTNLLSDTLSNYYSAHIIHAMKMKRNWKPFSERPKEHQKKILNNIKRGRDIAKKRKGTSFNTFEMMNAKGTCPDQLRAKIINFIHRFHRLPTWSSRRDEFNFPTFIYRFGSANKVYAHYGLPKKYGRKLQQYVFPDGSIHQVKNGMGYEELYQIMLKKCPILSNP